MLQLMTGELRKTSASQLLAQLSQQNRPHNSKEKLKHQDQHHEHQDEPEQFKQ